MSAGLMAKALDGPATAVLRAPPLLNTPLFLNPFGDGVRRWRTQAGDLIGEARPGDAAGLPNAPAPPTYAAAEAAGRRFPGLEAAVSPDLFHLRRQAG